MISISTKSIFSSELCRNEREVESKLIVSYLLPELGYDISMWQQQAKRGRFRLDFLAYTEHNNEAACKIVIEAKHPRKRLIDGRYQLRNYMLRLQINYGLLTNGRELEIYRWLGDSRIDTILNCQVENIADNLETIRSLIGRPQLVALNAQAIAPVPVSEIVTQAATSHFPEPIPAISTTKETISSLEKEEKYNNMKILAIFHNKGGVGKTTTTVNLADAIARTGKKVLIIDMDSQANTTYATGLMNFIDEGTDDIKDRYVYHLLRHTDKFPLHEVTRKARYSPEDIDVVPSHIHLMNEESGLSHLAYINYILLQKIKKSTKPYDIVLIDTPPSLDLYTRIALMTAQYLIIPSDLKVFANEGLENVRNLITEITAFQEMSNLSLLKVLGVLPNKILSNSGYIQNLKNITIPKIEARYGFKILTDYMITERTDLARSFDGQIEMGELIILDPKSIFEYNPKSPATGEFEQLATYILKQMEL